MLAWAEVHQATSIIDDDDARRVGQQYGLEVHGSLWLVAQAIDVGRITEATASTFVDVLIARGARYPCPVGGFCSWARESRLFQVKALPGIRSLPQPR